MFSFFSENLFQAAKLKASEGINMQMLPGVIVTETLIVFYPTHTQPALFRACTLILIKFFSRLISNWEDMDTLLNYAEMVQYSSVKRQTCPVAPLKSDMYYK